jgi:hypothetical protein
VNKSLAVRIAVAASVVVSTLVGVVAPGSPASASSGSLSVSPHLYVGGQTVTFQGNLGVPGQRRISLQFFMGRPGDVWTKVEGFHRLTAGDGSFKFSYPAPSMFNIEYRVASRVAVTPAYSFDARSQDLVLDPLPNGSGLGVGEELSGRPYTIQVDTTPVLPHRPDLPGPVFAGRGLTLQQRGGNGGWTTLDTATTDRSGNGSFTLPASPVGSFVYRVREENWTQGGSKVGWFPSFPLAVDVVTVGSGPATTTKTTTTSPTIQTTAGSAARTASSTYRWGPSLWDFGWEQGESLTSRPQRGSDRRGWWLDAATGLGRVAPHNGGLVLDSQRNWSGPGDFGTTTATLQGNARAYGRWEAKFRFKRSEIGAANYAARIELVPNSPNDYACGARNITVANVPLGGSTVGIGARNGARQWQATRQIAVPEDKAVDFAIEVTRRHITWFYNGDPIGTVNNTAAVSDVPLTMRLSLVGDPNKEMNKTEFMSDWQRGWDLHTGSPVTNGASLRRSTFSGGC